MDSLGYERGFMFLNSLHCNSNFQTLNYAHNEAKISIKLITHCTYITSFYSGFQSLTYIMYAHFEILKPTNTVNHFHTHKLF